MIEGCKDMSAVMIGPEALDGLMPMHLRLCTNGLILFAGPTMRRLIPPGARTVEDVFVRARGPAAGSVLAMMTTAGPGQRLAVRLRQYRQIVLRGHVMPQGDGHLLNFGFGVSLSHAVDTFNLTENDFAPTELALELMFLQEANRAIRQDLSGFNLHLMAARQDAERLAHTDLLTGALNRRGALAALHNALDPRTGQPFALVHLDLDNFKPVNDRFGHPAGDRLLCDVVQFLGRILRSRDHVARLGGDEFMLVLGGNWSCQSLNGIGVRIIEGIRRLSPSDCNVSASLGIVLSAGYGIDELDLLMSEADVALYQAKNAGKGRVSITARSANITIAPTAPE